MMGMRMRMMMMMMMKKKKTVADSVLVALTI